MATITKKQLITDFENGLCCIKHEHIYFRLTAKYLNGNEYTIRFDTFCKLPYVKSCNNYPSGFTFATDYYFFTDEIAQIFIAKYPAIKLRGRNNG